jgi:Flp pilus assembly protein TadD
LAKAGNFDQALAKLNRLLVGHSEDLDILFLKANTQLLMGNKDGARTTTLKLMTLDPSYPVPDALRELL